MISRFKNLHVKAVCARHFESAEAKARKYGIAAITYEEMLQDEEIEIIVNLTPANVHYEVVKKALLCGKHVYTEKTMTDDIDKTRELVALAKKKGLYLGTAPDTFLGAALQAARAAVDDGLIGEINSFVISGNRNNDILLSVFAFLRESGGGIVFDYGVYYVTALVSILGSVSRVGSIVRAPYPTHINCIPQNPLYGQIMKTPNESQVNAVIQMESGVTGTLHINADSILADQAWFMIYGTKGILTLTNPDHFGGQVKFIPESMDFEHTADPVVLWNFTPYAENSRGIGVADMADAILNKRVCRANMDMACHVQEILTAMIKGGSSGVFTDIISTCTKPDPLVHFFIHNGMDMFMSRDQFETFYWPWLKACIETVIDCGGIPHVYLEDKYDDKLDIFARELPPGKCIFTLINCNMERAKELFAGKICISGGIDGTLLQYGSPEDVVKNVKHAIDVLAPGGGYYLNADISLDIAKPENLHAMFDTARNYMKY